MQRLLGDDREREKISIMRQRKVNRRTEQERKGGQVGRMSDGSRSEVERNLERWGNGEGGDGGMIGSGRISTDDV